eukprot:g2125.t1
MPLRASIVAGLLVALAAAGPPSCSSPNEQLYYVDIKANDCGQVCVPASQATLIDDVLKAQAGACATATPYTVYNTTTSVKVPVIGSLTIATFSKPASAKSLYYEHPSEPHCEDITTTDPTAAWWRSYGYRYKHWKKGMCPAKWDYVNEVDKPDRKDHTVVHRTLGKREASSAGTPASPAASSGASGKTVKIAGGTIVMPSINLGTCCGSKPSVGLGPWLAAGGVGIDTAFDYHDQTDIATILGATGAPPREELFITTKVPAGFGNSSDCAPDPMVALNYIKENLKELGVDQVDLALVHRPCQPSQTADPAASNNALWKGMQMALKMNLTRAIGVSNYKAADLEALDMSGAVPAVNQCQMSIKVHDEESIAYCQKHGIMYESYFTMKGCPFTDKAVTTIAAAHNVSTSRVCLRWVLERGGILAVGTGADPAKAKDYAAENLDIYDFQLTAAEVDTLNKLYPQ